VAKYCAVRLFQRLVPSTVINVGVAPLKLPVRQGTIATT